MYTQSFSVADGDAKGAPKPARRPSAPKTLRCRRTSTP
jgi:hypothetical protein